MRVSPSCPSIPTAGDDHTKHLCILTLFTVNFASTISLACGFKLRLFQQVVSEHGREATHHNDSRPGTVCWSSCLPLLQSRAHQCTPSRRSCQSGI